MVPISEVTFILKLLIEDWPSVGLLPNLICLKLLKRHVYFWFQTKKSREQIFPCFPALLEPHTLAEQVETLAGRLGDWEASWAGTFCFCLDGTDSPSLWPWWPGRKCSMNKWILVFHVLWWMATALLSYFLKNYEECRCGLWLLLTKGVGKCLCLPDGSWTCPRVDTNSWTFWLDLIFVGLPVFLWIMGNIGLKKMEH